MLYQLLRLRPKNFGRGTDRVCILDGMLAGLHVDRVLTKCVVALSYLLITIRNRPPLDVLVGLFSVDGVVFGGISNHPISCFLLSFGVVNVLLIEGCVEVSLLW